MKRTAVEDALAGWRTRKKERQESLRGNLNPGGSGGAARSGARQEKKQSAKGLTCHKCGEIGHIQRNCHKGRSQGSAQRRRRAPTAILFGADQVRAVVGRDAAVGLTGVEPAVEIKQQRVEMPPL